MASGKCRWAKAKDNEADGRIKSLGEIFLASGQTSHALKENRPQNTSLIPLFFSDLQRKSPRMGTKSSSRQNLNHRQGRN